MTLSFAVLLGTLLPSAPEADAPRFSRHVEAVFSRLGCNGGTCHGAVKGQNGFMLSLFSADPAADLQRLLRDGHGRRLDLHDPAASLLLLKATGEVAHGGGKLLSRGSPGYELLRKWIAAGAPADEPERSRVTRLAVAPAHQTAEAGKSYALRVTATFADGTTEDVTPLCSFTPVDPAVASATADGRVTARGLGETAVIVRYRAEPGLAMCTVPRPNAAPFPDARPEGFVDAHVLAKLRRLGVPPAGLADDATFLRRASLDVAGELPTPAEVRAFLADARPDKRSRKIDELLARPGHAALWTLKFCDLLKASDFGVYADGMKQEVDAPRFQAWVRARLDENTPYDEFVERILTATSREGRTAETWANEVVAMEEGYKTGRPDLDIYRKRRTLDLYWQRSSSTGVDVAMQVAHAFLGLRLECARCHRHPHDVWQQDDFLSFANFFVPVRKIGFGGENEKKFPDAGAQFKRINTEAKTLETEAKMNKDAKAKQAATRRSQMLQEAARRVMHSEVRIVPGKTVASVTSPIGTQSSSRTRLLGQSADTAVPEGTDPRAVVMAWMRRPDNPYFAKAIVNRVWAHYHGRGIIDPPDDLSAFNPPTHPELLDDLCKGFVRSGYDLRWLHRTIATSRTYQQGPATDENEHDRVHYASFAYRRLPAEVLLDALNRATGTSEKLGMEYHHWPADMRAVEIPFTPKNDFVAFLLANFGKPKRNAAVQCDCERDPNASALQVLALANHPRLHQKLADDKGLVAQVIKEFPDDGRRVEELFLSAVSRLPSAEEKETCLKYVAASESPAKGLRGVLWSLINTREFLLQH